MKQTEMKSSVLQQLIEAMLGETGGKMKPKVMSVEIIHGKPKEGLEEVLDKASKDAPEMGTKDVDGDGDHDEDDHEMAEEDCEDDENDHEMAEEDCEDDEKKPRMSLKEFLSRK